MSIFCPRHSFATLVRPYRMCLLHLMFRLYRLLRRGLPAQHGSESLYRSSVKYTYGVASVSFGDWRCYDTVSTPTLLCVAMMTTAHRKISTTTGRRQKQREPWPRLFQVRVRAEEYAVACSSSSSLGQMSSNVFANTASPSTGDGPALVSRSFSCVGAAGVFIYLSIFALSLRL